MGQQRHALATVAGVFTCPDDGRPLKADACPLCRGLLWNAERFATRYPGAAAALVVESREDAGCYARVRPCPSCQAPMVPFRLEKMEAWIERCQACELHWIDALDVRVLERYGQRRAIAGAVASMSKEEQLQMAKDLSSDLRIPDSPATHEMALAAVGIPTLSRTEGDQLPLFTWLIASVLVLVHAAVLADGSVLERYVHRSDAPTLETAVAANFFHFGWLHLLGNVAFLLAFGSGVERKLPRGLVLFVFVGAGALSLAVEGMLAERVLQIAGASGGVAALLGTCVLVQPKARVNLAMGAGVLPLPLWAYGIFELAWQALMASAGVPGVAWWAHIVGLISGAVFGVVARLLMRDDA